MRSASGAGHQFRPLTYNAYRILGLSCSASQKEIFEAASSLRRALKLGVRKSFAEDLTWLGPVGRTEMDVHDALSRLANPAQRIYERLFWFYNVREAAHVQRLDDLKPAVDQLIRTESASGLHDAALLSLAVALRLSPAIEDGGVWRQALMLWKGVLEAKDFWSLLMSSDLKGDFEQLVTFAEIKELRQRSLQLITAPVADVARDAAARKDYNTCRRALMVLRESMLPLKLVARYENDILGPIEDELTALCDEVFQPVRFNFEFGFNSQPRKLTCDQTFYKYNQELKPRLKRFLDLAGAGSLAVYRIFEMAASGLKNLASVYGSAGEEATGVEFYQRAWALAPPGSTVAAEIEEILRSFNRQNYVKTRTNADYYQQLVEELKPLHVQPPGYPAQQASIVQEKERPLGCSTIAIIFGLALGLGLICNKGGGGSSSHNSNLPAYYNTNFYRPTYNANVYIPQPQFSPPPQIKIEPLIIPSLESGSRRPKVKRRKGASRQHPSH
jgi:hypothetical protein